MRHSGALHLSKLDLWAIVWPYHIRVISIFKCLFLSLDAHGKKLKKKLKNGRAVPDSGH